ncbi:Hypothetical predicted protein [Paramuricea clavata]|uniref:Uncharacterized protein n=1 Tax=Paramuricea clavata TaxID=317549 RepID=A0A6S7KRA2_PARCT|nr:Hypothetical predicted protein [Paramuricea clavata]
MNLVYVVLVIGSCAVCFGNARPADIRAWDADSEDLQEKRGNVDFLSNDIKARCAPGLWCINGKRETPVQNPVTPKQKPVRPAQKRKAREFRCKPGLHCQKRSGILGEETEDPIRRFPSSVRGQMADCVKYSFLCRGKAWSKLKVALNGE